MTWLGDCSYIAIYAYAYATYPSDPIRYIYTFSHSSTYTTHMNTPIWAQTSAYSYTQVQFPPYHHSRHRSFPSQQQHVGQLAERSGHQWRDQLAAGRWQPNRIFTRKHCIHRAEPRLLRMVHWQFIHRFANYTLIVRTLTSTLIIWYDVFAIQ